MRKVIYNRDPVHLGADFQPALYALESLQRSRDLLSGNAATGSHRGGGGCVPHVVLTCQAILELCPRGSIAHDDPRGAPGFEMQVGDSPRCIGAGTISLHRAERASKTTLEAVSGIESDDAAAARHEVHQALEGGFHSVEVLVNISVIKFNRRQDDGVRKVVQELWTLVEERSIVLIAFDDEVLPLSQLKAAAEVFRDSADQE